MFNRRDLARVASASTGAQANWLYRTQDTIDTVLAVNYFNDYFTSLKIDDVLQVKAINGYFFLSVIQSDFTQVAVTAIAFNPIPQPTEVLVGFSFDDQNPVGLDTPVTIEIGGTIGNVNDPVSMVNNVIQTNQEGIYGYRFLFPISRPSAAGIAYIFIRALVNGVQFGNPIAVALDDNNMSIPLEFTFTTFMPVGTLLVMEIYRDSAGNDSGGLLSISSSITWGQSASASVRVTKFG